MIGLVVKLGLVVPLGIVVLLYIYQYQSDPSIYKPVSIDTKNSPLTVNYQETKNKCTFKILREYFEKSHHLVGRGHWNDSVAKPYFQPDICEINYAELKEGYLAQCLHRHNISSIKTLGDSNAGRYLASLNTLFKRTGATCSTIKREEFGVDAFMPDRDYFLAGNKTWAEFVKFHYRFCSSCQSQHIACDLSYNHDSKSHDRESHDQLSHVINLEHIAMTMMLDDSIQILPETFRKASKNLKLHAVTLPHFILKHYLEDNFPDIFLVFLPFNHAKLFNHEVVKIETQYLVSLFKHYVPKTTKLFFMPAFAEFEMARTLDEWTNRTFENLLATDMINQLNHQLLDITGTDLVSEEQWIYPFMDLLKISLTRGHWATEGGIHLDYKWYNIIMKMFLATLCNSI